ncbi:MAG: SRPBCC family protein [Nitrospirae bacterium]|nr:SRPBCC family protein [Nitrospirota bacterium]
MATISRKIIINAPVEKVFSFVTAPDNWTKYVTSLTDIRDVSSAKVEKGATFKWEYKMFGMKFKGKGFVTENVKNKKFGLKMEGGFPIVETYSFTPSEKGTELSFDIEYEMPVKLMESFANKVVLEKVNKKEAAAVLSQVKTLCEEL